MPHVRALAVALVLLASCRAPAPPDLDAGRAPAPPAFDAGRAWADAERRFHDEPRWLGADAALTIPLGGDRILWLFGDTFVATSPKLVRSESKMVRNSVALQAGCDMLTASLSFHWRTDTDGSPASFFAERGDRFYWPGHGVRLDGGPLVVFLFRLTNTPGVGLGFDCEGYALAIVDDPDGPIERWNPRIVDAPALPFDALPATAVVHDNGWVVALAIRQRGAHAGALVRYRASALARADFEGAQWWGGEGRGWCAASELGAEGPAFVIDDAGAECSLHRDSASGAFVHVASYGFGATTIGIRSAPAVTGPWTAPRTVYRPPENDGPRPFVYAAKAHPELAGPSARDLVVTYATNSLEFGDLFTPDGVKHRYWPRVIAVARTD